MLVYRGLMYFIEVSFSVNSFFGFEKASKKILLFYKIMIRIFT